MMIIRSLATKLSLKPSRVLSKYYSSISTTGGQWQSSLGNHNKQPSRCRSARGRNGGHWRKNESLTRTSDGNDIPRLVGEGVYGIHSVLQALQSGHRDAYALYVREERAPTDGHCRRKESAAAFRTLERIRELAEATGVQIHPVSKWMLNHITGDKPHQGVVLDAAQVSLEKFTPAAPSAYAQSKRSPVLLVLDEIHDPQNVGAILRSAHFLGCSAIIISEGNSAPMSPAVSRASVGALEVLVANKKLMKANNLHEVLAISRDLGWRIVGASSGRNSLSSTKLSANDQPTILVMVNSRSFTILDVACVKDLVNEHRGLRKSIRQCCQDIATIPAQATDMATRVDSLNVSVASAILLYELLHH